MKKHFLNYLLAGVVIITIGCQQSTEKKAEVDPGWVAFEQNAKTVAAYLEAWQNENVDYDKFYSSDYSSWGTGFGDVDTVDLEQVKKWDQEAFENFDFKIANGPVNFLPGVDLETKRMDGSVRYYTEWEITRVATDSTEARTGNIRMYQAYNFNDEGKIIFDVSYGDFGGLMKYLSGEDE